MRLCRVSLSSVLESSVPLLKESTSFKLYIIEKFKANSFSLFLVRPDSAEKVSVGLCRGWTLQDLSLRRDCLLPKSSNDILKGIVEMDARVDSSDLHFL